MKTTFLIALFFISFIGFSQNNYIVKTEDGRRVLLKADYTWEYIDLEKPAADSTFVSTSKTAVATTTKSVEKSDDACSVAEGYMEPELNNKIQAQLKKGRATIDDVKRKVANDYNCEVEDVILLYAREIKANAVYEFCANGTAVTYKRNGYVVAKKIKLF